MNEIVVAKDIRKVYGINIENQVEALKNVDLTIKRGDYVCVMGPSGAGKSTLLNVLTTIDLPTSGYLEINGQDIRVLSESKLCEFRYQNLGFIFQDFNLIDSLTIQENIAVPLTMGGEEKKMIEKGVRDIAVKLGISHLLDKYPIECSGGQRQRVAIARALVTQPSLIVADEPTGNLDSQNSHELMMLFEQLNHEGTTILMVTHDALVASYSKELLYISDGEIKERLERGGTSKSDYLNAIIELNTKARHHTDG
jgi:ABC-type antimicrobial peptide transport system, ATPase component